MGEVKSKKAQIIKLDKEWWKKERTSTEAKQLLVKKPYRLSKEPLFTVKDVAKKLNVGIWSIYDYIASGELESQIVGRRKRISVEALEDFLMRQNLKRSA